MLPTKLAFVDIETTGMRSTHDRIIEIGILRVENGELINTFQSLINPQTYIPKEITGITGISEDMLADAPTFRSVKDDILSILDDCTFVAHNVRFDYGFIKSEFIRQNFTYNARHFCTVRLSRFLYPEWPRHNLDALIQHCGIDCTNRHRAFDDAQVLFHFYKHVLASHSPEQLEKAFAKTIKKPSLPVNLPMQELDKLPDKPGVYIFYGNEPKGLKDPKNISEQKKNSIPLYVGKSINIRNRVLSHFASDLSSPTEMRIAQQIESIETVTTSGELGALLLESKLIKEMLPLYNKRSRIKHELIALKSRMTKQGYLECYMEPITLIKPEKLDNFLGFFRSKRQAKAYLAAIAKEYTLCEKLLGLEKTSTSCFAYRLGKCNGACTAKELPIQHNIRLITAVNELKILPWPYKGPISIQESEMSGKKEYYIIDNWCYKAKVVVDEEGNINNDKNNEVYFDLDIYKILRQFIANPANQNKISLMQKALPIE